jgi:hypothetical protein
MKFIENSKAMDVENEENSVKDESFHRQKDKVS